ncbi:MAG: carbohydrate kinase family protein [Candidatus Magasanikbacteria bacterium]
MFDLITIGDATMDTFLAIDDATLSCDLNREHCKLCINYADKLPITHTGQSVGGNAANVAVACQKLGFNTALVTELGDDINGLIIKEELENSGVHTKLVKVHKGKETRYSVVLHYKSERTILSYHVKRAYSLPKLPQTKWIYYSSLGSSFEKLQEKLVAYVKRHPETKLATNPGSYQIKFGLQTYKKILPLTELLFVNKEEATKLVGQRDSIQKTMHALHLLGPRIVALTDGTKGSYASDTKTLYFMEPFPAKAIARTGAGDAYASGFLSAILSEETIKTAIQWGSANAGGVIQKFGAQKGLLTKNQIKQYIKKHSRVVPRVI